MNDLSETLGCRRPLVLNRLGEALRANFSDSVDQPLPDRLKSLCDALSARMDESAGERDRRA